MKNFLDDNLEKGDNSKKVDIVIYTVGQLVCHTKYAKL